MNTQDFWAVIFDDHFLMPIFKDAFRLSVGQIVLRTLPIENSKWNYSLDYKSCQESKTGWGGGLWGLFVSCIVLHACLKICRLQTC